MKGQRLLELLRSFSNIKVTILGDYILDQYMTGDTDRVSREAPVVVVNYKEDVFHAGGAANASCNVSSLGGKAMAVGVVGDDEQGCILRNLLLGKAVDAGGIEVVKDLRTAVKIRIMAGDLHAQKQQVARVDRSYRLKGGEVALEKLKVVLERAVVQSDAVLISDYGMGLALGMLGDLALEICRSDRKPVIVDSRHDLLSYPGATVATPNEVEALEALGYKERSRHSIEEISKQLLESAGLDSVIVTRGHLGMYVRLRDGGDYSMGIMGSSEATDVTGAGDTVAAAVALSLAAGGSVVEAAQMATCAAAVVVMKRGTAEVSPKEIEFLLEKHSML